MISHFKKIWAPVALFTLLLGQASAENLAQVYQDALKHDMTLQSAYYTLKQDAEITPQAWAALLPTISGTGAWTYNKTTGNTFVGGNVTSDDSTVDLLTYGASITQPIFDFTAFAGLPAAHDYVKSAYATYAYAQQTLMYNVIDAYFNVLLKEDNLRYADANKKAYYENYRQAEESFKVGVETKTDLYQAKASYDNSVSQYIAAKNDVSDAYEALRVITGKRYKQLTPLNPNFKFTKPQPMKLTQWVNTSKRNNWQVKSAYYSMEYARNVAKGAWGGHLPTLDAVGSYTHNTINNLSGPNDGDTQRNSNLSGGLNLTVPIFQGGEVSSQVRQYEAQYQQYAADYQKADRDAEQSSRTNYLQVVASASQIIADRNTIYSDKMALEGMVEGYRVGTQTMLDVLQSQQQLYDDLQQYAEDQYTYFTALASLKQAAATLSDRDITAVNSWLSYEGQNKAVDYVADLSSVYDLRPDKKLGQAIDTSNGDATNVGNDDTHLPTSSDSTMQQNNVDATANIPTPTGHIDDENIPAPTATTNNHGQMPSSSAATENDTTGSSDEAPPMPATNHDTTQSMTTTPSSDNQSNSLSNQPTA